MSSSYTSESLSSPEAAGGPSGTPPARRKSRRGLWIALAVIAVVLVAGGSGVAYYIANQSTPTRTLQMACDALKSQDYQTAYNLYTTDLQRQIGPEAQYAVSVQQSNSSKGGIANCVVSGVTEQGSSASGTVVIRFGNGSTVTDTVQLIDENGTWKISGDNPGS